MSETVTGNKNFTLKQLNDLNGMTFFVESYQRGYKWDIQQVLDLLNDIDEFEAIGSKFYCLQPVVVKKIKAEDPRIAEKMIVGKDKVYELIDGQQRLTTVFIILSLLSKDELPFQLIYKTRPESENFLNNISTIQHVPFTLDPKNIEDANYQLNNLWKRYALQNQKIDNVDNYHFFKACQLIHQWSKENEFRALVKKLLNSVKIIWYNIQKEIAVDEFNSTTINAEKIFMNFNQGRIQLEQAELIKALFVIKLKEIVNLEIRNIRINQFAEEWNIMENNLQDDRFWYFVSNDTSEKKRYNRIDLLFDIISEKPNKIEDNIFSYHYYLNSNNGVDQTEKNWKQIKDRFELLKEWYDDRLIYHLFGIIIYLQIKTIPDLITIYNNRKKVKNKTDFELYLKTIITDELKKPKYDNISILDYKSPEETKAILHLFNIITYHISDFNYRFPFDKLKTQIWSLEHIHAQNAEKFTEKKEFIDWITDMQPLLNEIKDKSKLKESKKLLEDLKSQELNQVKNRLLIFYKGLNNTLNSDNIANLCLLDSNTNSSLGNNNFKRKRKKILKVESTGEIELDGTKYKVFIPITTKNVFLKLYASDPSNIQFTYWGLKDREDYLLSIENQLSNFFNNA